MATLLASVDQLAARLGVTLSTGTADYARAEANLEDVSALARSEAVQTWEVQSEVPAAVKAVVLAAARRMYVNPDRYLSNMAGSFQATLSQSEFQGNIFLQGELDELHKFRPHSGLWTQPITRYGDEEVDSTRYYTDGMGGDPVLFLAAGDP